MANQTTNAAALAAVKERILTEIAALQTDGDGAFDPAKPADFGALGSRLAKAGVDWKSCGVSGNFTAFMEAAFRDEAARGEIELRLNKTGAHPNSRVRLTRPLKTAVASPAAPVPASSSERLSDAEVEKRVLATIRELQTNESGRRNADAWVDFCKLGTAVKAAGVDFKALGHSTVGKMIAARFANKFELRAVGNKRYVRPKSGTNAASNGEAISKPSGGAPASQRFADAELTKRVLAAIQAEQTDKNGVCAPSAWVYFANLCSRLKNMGVDFKAFGHSTFAKFMEARFADKLEFSGSSSTRRVRPKTLKSSQTSPIAPTSTAALEPFASTSVSASSQPAASGKYPNRDDAELADWAVVAPERFDELAALASSEKWRFDDAEPAPGEPRFPILESHIKYTFRQLAFEGKVKIAAAEDVAAFNTGLFDRKFDPIFAFFRPNVGSGTPPWRLSSFAVAGENADGKELIARFRPLPERARFFERREDLVFDGDAEIVLDAEHCLVERVGRLPSEFLRRCASPDFLAVEIDGRTWTLDEVADKPEKTPERRRYFTALEKKLPGSQTLVAMKFAFESAVAWAKKRAVANPRTVAPCFNPRKRNVCHLLPLNLVASGEKPERADVALVVERLPATGVYQGHTVYTLDMARKTASLTARLGGENWLDG